MFISKLKNNYKTANPKDWLTGAYDEIDPVFAGRLAYMAQSFGVKLKITEGFRSYARQLSLYKSYLNYKKTGKGHIKLAAKPGSSWHEYRLAIDTSTYPFRGMKSEELKAYGLCKPIKSELWHVQPIETLVNKDKKALQPVEKGDDEVVEKGKILVEGRELEVNRIVKNGENYIRLKDFDEVMGLLNVSYSKQKNLAQVAKKEK